MERSTNPKGRSVNSRLTMRVQSTVVLLQTVGNRFAVCRRELEAK
jgi:hypothetical protein